MTPTTRNILVIDDEPLIHDLVRVHLRDEPLEVRSATSGADGLALAARLAPDLVLLDVGMGSTNGWEVCRQLKADPATSRVPVIFLTAAADPLEKIRGLEMGAADYVTKPFHGQELVARVRAALRTKVLIDQLSERAMVDALTDAWNRSYLDRRVIEELALAARRATPLSVVMLDVDHFKAVNDRHGHAAGDIVLRHVVAVVRSCTRREDVVCRYGGEEFAVLLPNTQRAGAIAFAERVRVALAATPARRRDDVAVTVTASFGVADVICAADRALIEAADLALYEAKRAGRNRVAVYGSAPPLPAPSLPPPRRPSPADERRPRARSTD